MTQPLLKKNLTDQQIVSGILMGGKDRNRAISRPRIGRHQSFDEGKRKVGLSLVNFALAGKNC